MARIMVADDMGLALVGAEMLLNQERDFQVVGTFQCLPEALAALTGSPVDILLVGDRLEPGVDVLTLVDRVQRVAPHTRVIVMSMIYDGLVVHDLLTTGVAGYLYKSDLLQHHLANAVRTVMRGKPFLSPTANTAYLAAMQSGRREWQIDAEARDVLRLMSWGKRPQEIALLREISIRRVYWIDSKLRERFGAETNEHLIARAAEEGFLP